MYIFTMDGDATLLFFEAVKDLEEKLGRKTTEEERVIVLMQMADMGHIKSVMETQRTKDEVIKDSAKNFGKIMYLKADGTAEIIEPEDGDDQT